MQALAETTKGYEIPDRGTAFSNLPQERNLRVVLRVHPQIQLPQLAAPLVHVWPVLHTAKTKPTNLDARAEGAGQLGAEDVRMNQIRGVVEVAEENVVPPVHSQEGL